MECSFIQEPWFRLAVLPLLIFLSRIVDVSIGTMRVIFVSRGYKAFAALCGFFEVLIWLLAITQVMQNLTNLTNYIAYAGGFSAGNYIGMVIEERIALGHVLIRVISREPLPALRKFLKDKGLGMTSLNAEGHYGTVVVTFSILKRQHIEPVIDFLQEMDPNVFYTIEDIRSDNTRVLRSRSGVRKKKGALFNSRSRRKGK